MFLIGRSERGEHSRRALAVCVCVCRPYVTLIWMLSLRVAAGPARSIRHRVWACVHAHKQSVLRQTRVYTHVGVYNRTKKEKKRKDKEQFIPKGQLCFCGPPAAHHDYSKITVTVQRSSCRLEQDCAKTSQKSEKNINVVQKHVCSFLVSTCWVKLWPIIAEVPACFSFSSRFNIMASFWMKICVWL